MTKQVLLECTLSSVTAQLLEQLDPTKQHSAALHIWIFEDQQARTELAEALAARGINARVHSGYKPLIHFFLEEVSAEGLTEIDLSCPVNAAWPTQRFRLEAYPLAALYPGARLNFHEHAATPAGTLANAIYKVGLHYGERLETHEVFAPNRLRQDFLGRHNCVPSAWLMTTEKGHTIHTPLKSEYQQCYDAIIKLVSEYNWPPSEPYFDRLVIEASLPGIEQHLGVGHETISTTEALNEDIYFSLLEFFQRYSGRATGNRGLQPGQIIPDVTLSRDASAHLAVYYEPATEAGEPPQKTALPAASFDVAQLTAAASPLTHEQVQQALARLDGDHFQCWSRQQRSVNGVHIKGKAPAVFVSAAQHANETSGVVGALRAVEELRQLPNAHLVLLPLENPDGYALQQQLRKKNANHMHHAARYSALGDDIEYREKAPWFERDARNHAFAVSAARLHLNLHGYPAHEWTRPATGYLPHGFELWGIPKGFFLILRYRPEARETARALLKHTIDELAQDQALVAYNRRQLDIYRQHAGELPFEVMRDLPYMEASVAEMDCDVTLITEFPDETIYGEGFIFAHSVQAKTVVTATRWWWQHGGGATTP